LFLCTANSARSQAPEALAQAGSGGQVRASSAGSHPRPLHPHAVQVMAGLGIDIAGQRPLNVSHGNAAAAGIPVGVPLSFLSLLMHA
jgi:protein-tyrosine-phosphatase